MAAKLGYEVLVLDPIPQTIVKSVPNGDEPVFSPLSITMVHGERDAILVDPPFTKDHTQQVGDWFAGKNKRLTHIFITHGHGDHWFGGPTLADRFGGAQIVASPGTIHQMAGALARRPTFWDVVFKDQIPPSPLTAVAPPDNRFELEGHELRIVEVGHTDTDDSSVLHVPSLDLVVAGDVVYNGVHQYFGEAGTDGIDQWLVAIDRMEALRPKLAVAGHKDKRRDDDAARAIAETRAYLKSARELRPQCKEPLDFFNAMLALYPDRVNPGALWVGVLAWYGLR